MSTTESDEHDRGHGHGVLCGANEKQGRQGFVTCGLQFMGFGSVKDVGIVFSGIPPALTTLYRWLHGDTESHQQMLEGWVMADCCCSGTVDIHALQARQRRVLMIVLAINVVTFAMMMSAAIYSSSSSLLSGGLDNLGDALTYLLSLAVIGASGRAKAKVALLKGALILGAAVAVAIQIGWRLAHPNVPIFEAIGLAAVINLAFNGICLWLLTPYRHGDVNMASAWECSRNDVFEGFAVLLAAAGVWLFAAGWPDLVIAAALLVMFLRSAWRVFRSAWHSYKTGEA